MSGLLGYHLNNIISTATLSLLLTHHSKEAGSTVGRMGASKNLKNSAPGLAVQHIKSHGYARTGISAINKQNTIQLGWPLLRGC